MSHGEGFAMLTIMLVFLEKAEGSFFIIEDWFTAYRFFG